MAALRNGTGTAGTRPHSRRRWTDGQSDGRSVGLTKDALYYVAGFDRGPVVFREVQQIELRHRVLRDPQRLARAEHEPLDAHRGDEMREVILGRSPHPGDIPPHSRLLRHRRAPVYFLDERAVGVGDD